MLLERIIIFLNEKHKEIDLRTRELMVLQSLQQISNTQMNCTQRNYPFSPQLWVMIQFHPLKQKEEKINSQKWLKDLILNETRIRLTRMRKFQELLRLEQRSTL